VHPDLDGLYHMVYCTLYEVRLRTSADLREWGQATTILRMAGNVAPESPCLVRHGGRSPCSCAAGTGSGRERCSRAYQHLTYVYQSDDLRHFDGTQPVTVLHSHAPEVFQGEDGRWYISSAEWPQRGVSIARLVWADVALGFRVWRRRRLCFQRGTYPPDGRSLSPRRNDTRLMWVIPAWRSSRKPLNTLAGDSSRTPRRAPELTQAIRIQGGDRMRFAPGPTFAVLVLFVMSSP